MSTPNLLVLRLAQLYASLWRFRTLQLAEGLFRHARSPAVLSRPFFRHRLFLDVGRSSTHRLLFLVGERFVAERHLVASLLKPGMRVVDVGANIGYYLLMLRAAIGPASHVHCFEPDPSNLEELRLNIDRNALGSVSVDAAAVGAADGYTSLETGINARVVASSTPLLKVPMVSLDNCQLGRVDFLKIDVEGAEGEVILGAERVLHDHRPTLFAELHPQLVTEPDVLAQIVGRLGALYPAIELFATASAKSAPEKFTTRYRTGAGVARVSDPEVFLRALHARQDPFWLVARHSA